uniref:Uncharacterized protein n=1 Tax=Anguilla anguilla TaxID=7936 RepID=A0A0E9PIB3_ANGAN
MLIEETTVKSKIGTDYGGYFLLILL